MSLRGCSLFLLFVACLLLPRTGVPQGLTGTLIGTVRDEQGGVLPGAQVTLSSPALIGGPASSIDQRKRAAAIPGLASRALRDSKSGWTALPRIVTTSVAVGAGATIERLVVLTVAGIATVVEVEGGSRIEARGSGFETRFGADYIKNIPGRRYSLFDLIKVAPGVSPTSVGNSTNNTVSALGSGVNENAFLLDGTNFTCPCSGGAVAEPGIDVIQEVQVQTVGASAEFGNIQGAVFNVVTKQGSNAFQYDASYYWQGAGLTAQPIVLPVQRGTQPESGYERARYHDFTTNLGGPVVRNKAWFFAGYQYLRDYDSQPGTDPAFPRQYEQDKVLGKLTWQIAPSLRLLSSYHNEFWVSPERPTLVTPYETTLRFNGRVPTTTFAHVTYTPSSNTLWDARVGRFVLSQNNDPASGSITTPNRSDRVTGVSSGGPPSFGDFNLMRTTAKATMTHYRPGLLGADHELKVGGQAEKGHHDALTIIPTGVRYIDSSGQPFQAVSRDPATPGGEFITAGAFASDAMTIGDRLTINAGIRFDHNRAISPDLPARDLAGQRDRCHRAGPRHTLHLERLVAAPGRDDHAHLRWSNDAEGELRKVPSGCADWRTGADSSRPDTDHDHGLRPSNRRVYTSGVGGRSAKPTSVSIPRPARRARTSTRWQWTASSVAGSQWRSRTSAKNGENFIGWTDTGGIYREETRTMADGRVVPVFVLTNGTASRRFLLTNQDEYSLTYNGLVTAVEKRYSSRWHAFASYTWSRTNGLQPSSGGAAADAQVEQHARRRHVRARPEQPDQRRRATAKRSASHVPQRGVVGGAAHRDSTLPATCSS